MATLSKRLSDRSPLSIWAMVGVCLNFSSEVCSLVAASREKKMQSRTSVRKQPERAGELNALNVTAYAGQFIRTWAELVADVG